MVHSGSMRYTRRQALALFAGAAQATLLRPLHRAFGRPASRSDPQATPLPPPPDTWTLYGRAIHTVIAYQEPAVSSKRQAVYRRDESFPILEEIRAPLSAHNDLWYRTDTGFVPSAWVLPVRVFPSQPWIADPGPWGFWGEVSQIFTDARPAPTLDAPRKYRFYGGTVYHVIEATQDDAGNGWYKVVDDYPPRQHTNHQWVLAQDMRRLPEEELAPIRPFGGQRRIEIVLSQQTLTCYEGDTPVFTTPIASGIPGDTATPKGEFCVLLKQPSRHMSNRPYPDMPEEERPAPENMFDLPGVPWNVFFDLKGRAIHGTYWHNDFGVPRSHGCVNVSIQAARWIYRWVHPVAGYADDFVRSNCRVGTPILIT